MFRWIALFALVGCGPFISVEKLNAPARPMTPRAPGEVELLTQRPTRPFVEVAMIQFEDSAYDATLGTPFEKIRARGAKMGCDAVVIVGRDDGTELFDRRRPVRGYMASCLQYREPTAQTGLPSSPPSGGGSIERALFGVEPSRTEELDRAGSSSTGVSARREPR